MDKGVGHLLYVLTENRRLVPKIVLATNAAHKFFGPLEFSVDHCWRGHGRLGPLTGAVRVVLPHARPGEGPVERLG